jgi:hypothetical protein
MIPDNKDWFVSTSQLAGKEIITRGRRNLDAVYSSKRFGERIEISWSYPGDKAGMPSPEQDRRMLDIAFELADALEKADIAYLTATYTGRDLFIMVFYTASVERFADVLHEVLGKYEQLPLEIGRVADPDWEDYFDMLNLNINN